MADRSKRAPRIVAIGGGTGLSTMLRGLKHVSPNITAVVAEIVNIASHLALHDRKREPNMFNITPYCESTQPVFHEIALAIGIIPEIVLYLVLIILVAFGIFILERIYIRQPQNN